MAVTIRGSGQVPVQIAQGTLTTPYAVTVTFGTYYDAGISATITPTSASNKILIMAFIGDYSSSSATDFLTQIQRNGTAIINGTGGTANSTTANATNGTNNGGGSVCAYYLDSPASTSALTYKFMVSGSETGKGIYVNRRAADTYFSTASTIILMELAYS